MREVFPNTLVKGCSFHWSQQVYQKVTRLGLATAYTQKEGVHHNIRKLLVLPYLPAEYVRPAFTTLREQGVESESARILDLVEYIGATWVEGRMWHPENWSVYMETIDE